MPVLSLPISVFESVKDNEPLGMELQWPGDLDEWREVADKEDAPLWSPVTYREGGLRVKNQTERNILSVHALVFDYDRGATAEAARAAWDAWEHAGYTTHSHLLVRPPKYRGEPRFRLVIPLRRPVSVAEFKRLWAWAHEHAAFCGVPFDPLADVGRLYFVPSHRPGAAPERAYWHNPSPDVLDPDEILAYLAGDAMGGSAPGVPPPSSSPPPVAVPAMNAGASGGGEGLFSGIRLAHQTEDLGRIEEQCAWMRHCRDDAATLPEPEWYAWLSVVVRCRDGNRLAHEIGSAYPGYSREETDDKLARALSDSGPRTCTAIRQMSPACRGCVLGQPAGPITSPVLLGKPATATAEEVREDTTRRIAALVERAKEQVAARTREVAEATVEEARQRALAQHARQYGTPDVAAEEAGKLAAARARLKDAKAGLKEAERAQADAERDARQARRLDKADPRILNDPLFALDLKTGLPRSSLGNVTLILEGDAAYAGEGGSRFRYDLFSDKLYYGTELAADHVDTDINIDIERRYGFASKTTLVQEAIVRIAHEHAFHPVRDYLSGVEWDGTGRIDDLLRAGFGAQGDAAYLAEAGRKFMVGMVARVFSPGCKLDTMLVLAGKQGIGKSSGLRLLAGSTWFADSALALGDKDAYMQLAGRWLYEISELDSFKKVESTRIKAFVSSQEDTYRPPFGRHVVKRPRQTVLVGTTNEREFLNDPTGSRRFVPVPVGAVDLAWLAAHRDLLWAEAVVCYRRGEAWHYAGESADRLARESAPFQQDDPWEPLVHDYLARRKLPTVTVLDALTGAVGVGIAQIGRTEKTRMVNVLRALHCEDEDGAAAGAAGGAAYRARAFRVPRDVYESNVVSLPAPRAPAFTGVS